MRIKHPLKWGHQYSRENHNLEMAKGMMGKITFVYAPENFECQGQSAPQKILNLESGQWRMTENAPEKMF
jgi:hypothetical protein